MQKPKPTAGLHHVALFIKNFAECEHFYTELLGMSVDWRPDADNLYLTSGNDNFEIGVLIQTISILLQAMIILPCIAHRLILFSLNINAWITSDFFCMNALKLMSGMSFCVHMALKSKQRRESIVMGLVVFIVRIRMGMWCR